MQIELNTKLPGCSEDQDRLYAPALENLKRLYEELVPLLREAEAELQAEFGLRMQWEDLIIGPEISDVDDGFLYFFDPSLNVDAVNEKGYPVTALDRWEEEGRPHNRVFEPLRDLDWSNLDKLKDDSAPSWIEVTFWCYHEDWWGKEHWEYYEE